MCIERKGTGKSLIAGRQIQKVYGNKGLVKCLVVGRKIQQVYGNKGSVKCFFLTDGEICESTFTTGIQLMHTEF